MVNYVLVTGGLGFIGSHICIELLQNNKNVFIVDNLENSSIDVLKKIKTIVGPSLENNVKYSNVDLRSLDMVNSLFKVTNIDSIIHCAGKKSVNESIHNPAEYYYSNITMTLNLLKNVEQHNIDTFIFSSSATVYGDTYQGVAFEENMKVGYKITNPYGNTKFLQENILLDCLKNTKCNCVILRYFNPVGCHHSGLLGENPQGVPTNIMPYLLRVASKNNISSSVYKDDNKYSKLTIFGNDYDTIDGTCIRDYIHVVDLAKAHVLSLIKDKPNKQVIYNVGTGNGVSVKQLVEAFIVHNNAVIPYNYDIRREGDPPIVVCNPSKIMTELGWKPIETLQSIVKTSWNFINNQ